MALTIDSANLIVTQPRADMLDVTGGAPSEIRQFDIDDFRSEFGALLDDEAYVSLLWGFEWTQPKVSGGITYAPFFEMINGWTMKFEDGAYSVNVVGGNSNVSDVTIKNQVGVNTANSAGLQDSKSLQASSFLDGVSIDIGSGITGTTYPRGTKRAPVDNLTDAVAICVAEGVNKIRIVQSMTIDTGTDLSAGYTFYSDRLGVIATIDSAADVTNCSFEFIAVTGELDANNGFFRCEVFDAESLQATLTDCGMTETLTLGGSGLTELINCHSGSAGGGAGQYPTIDMGGTGNDLLVRDYSGGLAISNLSDVTADVSIDCDSGRIIIDSTVTAGTITVRGFAEVTDNSTGTAVIDDRTVERKTTEQWQVLGLDSGNPMTVTPTSRDTGDISQVISGDGETTSTVTRS